MSKNSMQPTFEYQIQFLQNLQRILKEGVFVSTYKYALLYSIADFCVESGTDDNAELTITTRSLASKFIGLYWSQSTVFPNDKNSDVLYQNVGKQAAIINQIRETKMIDSRLPIMRLTNHYKVLQKRVAKVIQVMPLWKLQIIGDAPLDFLYEQVGKGNTITLKPGVSYCFRKFYGQITDMLHSAWIRWIQKAKKNQGVLGHNVNLENFLFESRRSNLQPYVAILREEQLNNCFYCAKEIRGSPEVDHFIPWSRYPVDLGHNFVLSHKSCNGDKSDYLASEDHLEKWHFRNQQSGQLMTNYFNEQNLMHDYDTTLSVSKWAYQQCFENGAMTWTGYKKELRLLVGDWEYMFAS